MGNYVTEDGWIRCRVKEVERNPVTEEGIGEEEIELKDLWKTRKYVREKTRIYDTPKHLSHALELWCLSMITSDVKYKGVNSYTHTTSSTQKRRTHTHTYTQYTKKKQDRNLDEFIMHYTVNEMYNKKTLWRCRYIPWKY